MRRRLDIDRMPDPEWVVLQMREQFRCDRDNLGQKLSYAACLSRSERRRRRKKALRLFTELSKELPASSKESAPPQQISEALFHDFHFLWAKALYFDREYAKCCRLLQHLVLLGASQDARLQVFLRLLMKEKPDLYNLAFDAVNHPLNQHSYIVLNSGRSAEGADRSHSDDNTVNNINTVSNSMSNESIESNQNNMNHYNNRNNNNMNQSNNNNNNNNINNSNNNNNNNNNNTSNNNNNNNINTSNSNDSNNSNNNNNSYLFSNLVNSTLFSNLTPSTSLYFPFFSTSPRRSRSPHVSPPPSRSPHLSPPAVRRSRRGQKGPPPFPALSNVEELCQGRFGDLFLVEESSTGTPCVLKELSPQFVATDMQLIHAELSYLASLAHPNLVEISSFAASSEASIHLLLPYFSAGSLADLIAHRGRPLSVTQAAAVLSGVLKGLQHLHANDVVHQNLRCANIFLSDSGDAKLADYGLAHRLASIGAGALAPQYLSFVAPDAIKDRSPSYASDIWSLGITTLEMVHGQAPFLGHTHTEIILSIISGELLLTALPYPELQSFISACLSRVPSLRPTASALLYHPLINSASAILEIVSNQIPPK